MTNYDGEEFADQQVRLNGNEFRNCIFRNCTLVFDSTSPIVMVGCGFENPRVYLEGAAANTMIFLSKIYQMDGDGFGRSIVERIFAQVRGELTE